MGVRYEDRGEILRLHPDIRQVVQDLPRVGIRGGVDEDESVIHEERSGRIGLDDVHAFERFHSSYLSLRTTILTHSPFEIGLRVCEGPYLDGHVALWVD